MKRVYGWVGAWVLAWGVALPGAGAVVLEGNWAATGNTTYAGPAVGDLGAFREYFRAVLKGYDQYAARADVLADGIVGAGPIELRLDDVGDFGELGDTVAFNPLATGGTQDIATGGDYIDRQLNGQKHRFEIASVDLENNVFRQDFGPVQAQRVSAPPGGDPAAEWFRFSFLPDGVAGPGPSAEVFANNPTARLEVLPEPGTAVVLGLGGLLLARRRRRAAG